MSDCLVSQVKIGLSGVNSTSLGRLHHLISDRVVDVIAILEPSEEYCFAAKTLCVNARRYEQFDHLLSCDLDGIIIATPNIAHIEEVNKSLERGIPVFCPKSLGRTVNEDRSIINSAILNDRLLQVDLSLRYVDELKLLKKMISNNLIGEVFSIDAVFYNGIPPEYCWCYEKEAAGGGCLLDTGIPVIDLILWLFDYPEIRNPIGKLYSGGKRISQIENVVEDFASVQFEFENDCNVQIKCGWNLNIGCESELCISIFGTDCGVRIRNLDGCLNSFQIERFCMTNSELISAKVDINKKNAISNWIEMLLSGNVRYNPEMEMYMITKSVIDNVYNNSNI